LARVQRTAPRLTDPRAPATDQPGRAVPEAAPPPATSARRDRSGRADGLPVRDPVTFLAR